MSLSVRQVLARAGVTTQKHIVSLLYFLTFAALACNGRFMAIFFRDDLGLSSGDIGFVLACGTFVGLFSTPTWSVREGGWRKDDTCIITGRVAER